MKHLYLQISLVVVNFSTVFTMFNLEGTTQTDSPHTVIHGSMSRAIDASALRNIGPAGLSMDLGSILRLDQSQTTLKTPVFNYRSVIINVEEKLHEIIKKILYYIMNYLKESYVSFWTQLKTNLKVIDFHYLFTIFVQYLPDLFQEVPIELIPSKYINIKKLGNTDIITGTKSNCTKTDTIDTNDEINKESFDIVHDFLEFNINITTVKSTRKPLNTQSEDEAAYERVTESLKSAKRNKKQSATFPYQHNIPRKRKTDKMPKSSNRKVRQKKNKSRAKYTDKSSNNEQSESKNDFRIEIKNKGGQFHVISADELISINKKPSRVKLNNKKNIMTDASKSSDDSFSNDNSDAKKTKIKFLPVDIENYNVMFSSTRHWKKKTLPELNLTIDLRTTKLLTSDVSNMDVSINTRKTRTNLSRLEKHNEVLFDDRTPYFKNDNLHRKNRIKLLREDQETNRNKHIIKHRIQPLLVNYKSHLNEWEIFPEAENMDIKTNNSKLRYRLHPLNDYNLPSFDKPTNNYNVKILKKLLPPIDSEDKNFSWHSSNTYLAPIDYTEIRRNYDKVSPPTEISNNNYDWWNKGNKMLPQMESDYKNHDLVSSHNAYIPPDEGWHKHDLLSPQIETNVENLYTSQYSNIGPLKIIFPIADNENINSYPVAN